MGLKYEKQDFQVGYMDRYEGKLIGFLKGAGGYLTT